MEGMIDECAHAAGQDPLAYRLRIHDAMLTTDAAGATTQGKVTIEWDR